MNTDLNLFPGKGTHVLWLQDTCHTLTQKELNRLVDMLLPHSHHAHDKADGPPPLSTNERIGRRPISLAEMLENDERTPRQRDARIADAQHRKAADESDGYM